MIQCINCKNILETFFTCKHCRSKPFCELCIQECTSCHNFICPSCIDNCHECGDPTCFICSSYCTVCGKYLCGKCGVECVECGKFVCLEESAICITCKNYVCETCVSSHLCFSLIKEEVESIEKTEEDLCLFCESEMPEEAKFCPDCGTEIKKMICNICNGRILPSDDFVNCANCKDYFHKEHLLKWIKTNAKCPNCEAPISERDVI